jgi:hypothetical protein
MPTQFLLAIDSAAQVMHLHAEVWVMCPALYALSAGCRRVNSNRCPRDRSAAVQSGDRDDTDDFMAKDHRCAEYSAAGGAAFPIVQVADAYSAEAHPHNGIPRSHVGQRLTGQCKQASAADYEAISILHRG